MPLISIRSKPLLRASNFNDRLRSRLKEMPQDAVTAFLSDTSGIEMGPGNLPCFRDSCGKDGASIEVARILGAES